MESEVESSSRICPVTPTSKKGLALFLKHRTIFIAVSLTFILTTAGLVYYLMLSPPLSPLLQPSTPKLIPHGAILIDGDTSFAATALLEGWTGDGSPENPFIIDGLDIDLHGVEGHCIRIGNTRVSFIIRSCSLTGASIVDMDMAAGVYLENVTNGELVNNICNDNWYGITLFESDHNTVANNTCTGNNQGITLTYSSSNTLTSNMCYRNNRCRPGEEGKGIYFYEAYSNTLANNTCYSNDLGIYLEASDSNTVVNNTCISTGDGIYLVESDYNNVVNNICTSNVVGIHLVESDYNTMASNICNYNNIGIALWDSYPNVAVNNTFLGNSEHDIFGLADSENHSSTDSTPTTTTTATSPTPTVSPPPGDIIAIGGGVAVAAIVLAVVFLRRR